MDISLGSSKRCGEVYILRSIYKYLLGKDADSIQNNKFKSEDWDAWCDFIKNTKDNTHLNIVNNSTGQNMCFMAIVFCKGIITEQLITAQHFYIQKSIVGDFVTFYGTIDTTIIYENNKLRHPQLMVVSQISPFSDLFESAWDLMQKYYPNCCYVSYRTLTIIPTEPQFQNKTIYELLFGYEGKLKTNYFGDRHFTPEDF